MHRSDIEGGLSFLKVRKSLTALLYRKLLRLSLHSIRVVSEGKILNAVTADMTILDYGQYCIPHLFYDPIAFPIFLVSALLLAGPSVLWGFLFGAILMTLMPLCGRKAESLRKRASALTDERLKLLFHAFSAVRLIKCYALEAKL